MRPGWWFSVLLLLTAEAVPETPEDPPSGEPVVEAVDDPPPPREVIIIDDRALLGQELLDEAMALLAQGDFEAALLLSVPAISDFPELTDSFRAIASLATDQIHRKPSAAAVMVAPPQYGRRVRSEDNTRLGFTSGLPTGFLIDWKMKGQIVDSMGLLLGGNITFGSTIAVIQVNYYIDWKLGETLHLNTPIGLVFYSASPYAMIGIGLQYDPPSPLQVNVGVGAMSSAVVPNLSVGFLW